MEQKIIRCAVYTRKSTEEGLDKEFNTLEAQREAGENAKDAKHNKIFGWVSFAVGTLIGIAGIILGIIF